MKATLDKSDLLRAVQIAERAASTKSSLPILSAMLLAVEGATLTVKATDLEVSLQTRVEGVEDAEDGAAAVPAKQFVEYVRAAPGASVSLSVDEKGTMTVKSGKSRFKLQVYSSDEFPVMPEVAQELFLCVDEKALAEALGRTLIAAATEDTRPNLCGVLWRLKKGEEGLTMVATDTHRLHLTTCPLVGVAGTAEDVLVSGRTCREMQRLLGASQSCDISIDKNQIQVTTAAGTLVGRRLDGKFPEFAKVVPDYTDYLGLNRDDLAEVVKRAGIVAKDGSNRIHLEFADGQPLAVTADAADGRAEEEVEFSGKLKDQDKLLAANWRFLLEAVQSMPDEALRFHHQGALRPILLTGVDPSEFLAVVMPMSLQ